MIALDERKEFIEGRLQLECLSMTVEQLGAPNPKRYSGPGFIRQNSERELEFKLYDSESPGGFEIVRDLFAPGTKPGILLGDSHYYSLRATDLRHREWVCERVSIHRQPASGLQKGLVIWGSLRQIHREGEPASQGSPWTGTLEMWFNDTQEIPATNYTEIRTQTGENVSTSSKLDHVSIALPSAELLIHSQEKGLLVQLRSKTELPDNAQTRIMESLQFVLGRDLWWSFISRRNRGDARLYFRSEERADATAKMDPPIRFQASEKVWLLFSKYLNFIWDFPEEKLHAVSGWLHFVRGSNRSYIFTRGLALGIAVEGILKICFPREGSPSAETLSKIELLEQHIRAWNVDGMLQTRAVGAVQAFQSARAKEALHYLKNIGVISDKEIQAWGKVRNKTAHATPPGEDDLQQWIDYTYCVEVLLYKLIFKAIGYVGVFTDYSASTEGWPLRNTSPG